jgi:hypothetical protein
VNKKLINLSMAAVLLGGPAIGHSATLDTFSADGILQNFSGFDWHSNGSGWVQGFNLPNAQGATVDFGFTYQAFAGVINTTSPTPNLFVSSPGPEVGTYEVTTFATLQQTATCLAAGPTACASIQIDTNSGQWRIFLDDSPDSNAAAGTGFLDGVNIISGTWDSGLSTFISNGTPPGTGGALGSGGGFLTGTVTMTNNTFVNPNLVGTQLQASLQFPGENAPNFTPATAFNGVATGANTPTDFVLQTDTSQNFTAAIPEPSVIALLGIGMLGFGLSYRRRA